MGRDKGFPVSRFSEELNAKFIKMLKTDFLISERGMRREPKLIEVVSPHVYGVLQLRRKAL